MSTISERFIAVTPGPSFSLTTLVARVLRGLSEVQRRHELNRSRKLLGQLDDRLLRDIGIDRATAKHEAVKNFWS